MDKGYFNSNILKLVNDDNKTISKISVDKLIHPNRVDVVIKAIYAKHYKNGTLIPFIVDLYTNHINCINGFVENDESKKIGKKNFLKSFHSLIDDISRNGFHTDTILPVGKKNIILDGAHRLSTQLGTKKYLNIINLDNPGIKLDFTFFKNRGLKQVELDYTAAEYAKLDSKSRVIIIWPLGKAHERELLNIFDQYGERIYRKDIRFNLTGVTQLVRVAYSKEKWLGNIKNDTFYFNDANDYYQKAFKIDNKNLLLCLNFANSLQSINKSSMLPYSNGALTKLELILFTKLYSVGTIGTTI